MKALHQTRNSLSKATRAKVVGWLNQTLANLSDLYSQTKQAHWNVRGPAFFQLHKLFDEIANLVEGSIDPVAERITALGGTAQGTVRQAASASALPEFPASLGSDLAFVDALIERYGKAANAVRKQVDDTADAGDTGSSDLLTGTSRELDQALWFLEAHRKG